MHTHKKTEHRASVAESEPDLDQRAGLGQGIVRGMIRAKASCFQVN